MLRQATHTSDQVKEALLAQQADHKVALHEGVRSTLRDAFKSDRAIEIFKQWDEDGNGTIDKKEFRRAIRQMGLSAENEDLDAVSGWTRILKAHAEENPSQHRAAAGPHSSFSGDCDCQR